MSWLKTAWKWILGALAVAGVIALYVFMSKDDTDRRVADIESKIGAKEKEIEDWEKKRKEHLDSADTSAEEGKKLEKEIEKAKAKKTDLGEKRKKMKDIFDKYNAE